MRLSKAIYIRECLCCCSERVPPSAFLPISTTIFSTQVVLKGLVKKKKVTTTRQRDSKDRAKGALVLARHALQHMKAIAPR